MGSGKHLRFVKNDHAVGNVMKLPALGGTVGIERFKKLDGGRYDHRRIPVFGGQPLPAFCIVDLLVGIKGRAGVMLDHVGFP